MKIYVSVVSLLTVWDALFFLFTRKWPSFDTLVERADALEADGVQLLILKGWEAEDIFSSDKICSIEPAWGGFVGDVLFDKNSETIIEEILELRKHGNFPTIHTIDIESVEGKESFGSLIEISGKKTKTLETILEALRAKRPSPRKLVLDTHHVREILPNSSYKEWMPPLWKTFLGYEPKTNKRYVRDDKFRLHYNHVLREAFSAILPRTKVIQVQTRSVWEATRCMRDVRSILSYELQLLSEFFITHPQERFMVPIVIEIPPWWGWFSSSFKKRFITSVRQHLQ
jgi:hypothetical protein